MTAAAPELTGPERALRVAAAVLLVVSIGFGVVYLVQGIAGPAEFPYATNSVAKDVLLAALAYLIVRDVRRWAVVAVPLIVLAHVVDAARDDHDGAAGRPGRDRQHLGELTAGVGVRRSAWAGSPPTSPWP